MMDKLITDIMEMSLKHDPFDIPLLAMKLSEEVGEFNEALLIELGHSKHKHDEEREHPIYEAADIINVLCGILIRLCYAQHEMTPEQTLHDLKRAVREKGNKYARLMGAKEIE